MRRWIKAGTRLASVAAVGGLLVAAPAPQEVTYSQSNCTNGQFVKAKPRTLHGEVITLSCGGIGGAVGGASVGVARAGGAIPRSAYGIPGPKPAVRYSTELTPKKMRTFVQKRGVPWPAKGTIRAQDMDTYGVYQLTYKDPATGKSRTYKFGITKKGASRPESQLGGCAKAMGVQRCRWQWVPTGVPGWRKARMWEAHHAARYKAKHKECPPGMKRCL